MFLGEDSAGDCGGLAGLSSVRWWPSAVSRGTGGIAAGPPGRLLRCPRGTDAGDGSTSRPWTSPRRWRRERDGAPGRYDLVRGGTYAGPSRAR